MHPGVTLVALRIIAGLCCLGLWQALSILASPEWVSPPLLVLQRMVRWLVDGTLWPHILMTIQEAFWGFALGIVLGVGLPFLLRRHPLASEVLGPLMVGGYGMPKLALAPIFILWFGVGMLSKVAVVFSIVFFLVFFNTTAGIQGVNPNLIKVARIMGAREAHIVRHILWPSAVPYIFTGLKISVPYAIAGAVIGELISADRGIGYFIEYATNEFDTAGVFVGLIVLSLLIVIMNQVVKVVEAKLLSWRVEEREIIGM